MIAEIPYQPDYQSVDYVSERKSQSSYIRSKPRLTRNVEYIFKDTKINVQAYLRGIIEIIKKSESILMLEDNWDDMGSEKISEDAWKSTFSFLITYSENTYKEFGYLIDKPRIYPSVSGSIDIAWETETYAILLNIDKSGEVATYYADDKNDQMSKGIFNPKNYILNLLPRAISV